MGKGRAEKEHRMGKGQGRDGEGRAERGQQSVADHILLEGRGTVEIPSRCKGQKGVLAG